MDSVIVVIVSIGDDIKDGLGASGYRIIDCFNRAGVSNLLCH
jgi:hypothetical protein